VTLSRVLIVEDDPDIQMLAGMSLKDLGGLEIRTANDGQQALELLDEWRPDLVLMDVMMPNLTGPETLEKLKANDTTSQIPVVLMTAKSERDQVVLYRAMGAAAVIVKPFEPLTLADHLRAIFDETKI